MLLASCYPYAMTNIKDFLTSEFIEKHPLPSNFTYGKAICDRSAVEFIEIEGDVVEAWAGGRDGTVKQGAGSRRRVTFIIEKGAVRWNCTGNQKNHQIFCKHCAAVALALKGSRPLI